MLFRFFPFSIFFAFFFFIAGYLFQKLELKQWANYFLNSGLFFLMLVYAKAALGFIALVMQSLYRSTRHYVSAPAAHARVELSHRHKLHHQTQLHKNHKKQLLYRHSQLRNRFIKANNKSQALQLSKAIRRHLHAKREALPRTDYQAYRQALHNNHRNQNIAGLLKLQFEISHR
ncbi:MAG: hypothetical protein KGZ88_04815 [Methylomicrobium sp.]|nr:hypothetical protein [Methylomicrobium sp.]